MAIKLQSTLVEEFSYISLHDEALDTEGDADEFAEAWKKYRDGAIPMPPLKDGKEPTIFTLRPLTDPDLSNDLAQYQENRTKWFCEIARYSIVGIQNLCDEDGEPVRVKPFRRNGFRCIPDDVYARLHSFGRGAILAEIGMHVLTHNSPS
jgi:hypothetical protein